MLTPDLVRARRRGTELSLVKLGDEERTIAVHHAEALVLAAEASVGTIREELDACLVAVPPPPLDRRLSQGLLKLTLDRCDVESEVGADAPKLRAALFSRAAAERQRGTFQRDAILDAVATEFEITKEAVVRGMYGDLRAAHLVRGFETTSGERLVREYEDAQMEAVLLRATRVRVHLLAPTPQSARLLFRRVKFLGLLFAIERALRGYMVVIDGPMSLFEASTSYGLKFALLSRSLSGCGAWSLEADVLWGREKTPLLFRAHGDEPFVPEDDLPLSDDLLALKLALQRLDGGWDVRSTTKILHLPGVGMSVPDLVFSRGQTKIYFEVLGYWSRTAVWRRVELVEAGLAASVLFAVSQKLRVSEEVLSEETPSSLYVFRRAMNARSVLAKLNELTARSLANAHGEIADPEDELEKLSEKPKGRKRSKKGDLQPSTEGERSR